MNILKNIKIDDIPPPWGVVVEDSEGPQPSREEKRKVWQKWYASMGDDKREESLSSFSQQVRQKMKKEELDDAEMAIFNKMKVKNKVLFEKKEDKPIANLDKKRWIEEMKKMAADIDTKIAKPPQVEPVL